MTPPTDDIIPPEELAELVDSDQYVLAALGSDVLNEMLWDIARGAYAEFHGVTDEDALKALLMLARQYAENGKWEMRAYDWYKENK